MPPTANTPPPPADEVMDWLLSSLSRRLFGVADLGLLKLLESPAGEYALFAERHFARPLRSLSAVTALAVAERPEPVPSKPLEGLVVSCEMVGGSLAALAGFRTTPQDARRLTRNLRDAWVESLACVRELARSLKLNVSALNSLTSEREQGYRDALARLADDLDAARAEHDGGGR